MDRVRALGCQIGWFWRSLMGDNHYQRYVAHRRRAHAEEAVITEREFWRLRHRVAATGSRCC